MERLREHESHEMDAYAIYNAYEQRNKIYPQPRHSVLSPDNRQFLEQPRSKSPDMRNKRMIIGKINYIDISFSSLNYFLLYFIIHI